MQNDLKIPKNKKSIRLALINNKGFSEDSFTVFLSKFSAHKTGEETLDEFLNSDKSFLPFENDKTNDFLLINKESILYVSSEFQDDYLPASRIIIDFVNDIEKEFDFVNENEFYRSRLADTLNCKELFVPFYSEKRKFYVNRKLIKTVKEL